MEDDLDRDTALSLGTLAIAAITIAVMLLWVLSAAASQVCLTKKEARVLWPRQHLYWYSADHCWSNRRGPPRGLKVDPINNSHAEEVVSDKPEHKKGPHAWERGATIKIVKADEYNELDAAADADTFFNAQPFPYQQYVLNLERYKVMSWYRQIWGLAKEGK